MECHEAQAIASEVLDGAAPDDATLEAAQQHCRSCADCTSFVRALNLVKRASLPEPPAGLTDRVMDAVRREAATEQARAEAAAAAALAAVDMAAVATAAGSPDSAADAPVASQAEGDAATLLPMRSATKLPSSAALAAWVGAAAVLIATVGTIGVIGVRMISQEPTAKTASVIGGAASAPNVAGDVDTAPPPSAEGAASGATQSAPVSTGSNFIEFQGTAYRLVGPSPLKKDQLKALGTTTTSLDGGASRAREVLGTPGTPGVYVEGDQGGLLEFQPLERKFEGLTYRLQSAAIPAFGTWPVMPSEIAQPTAADGSPTFSAAGTDSSGISIYRLASSASSKGIAVAPGAPQSDPANGNPNWTWWTPAP